MLLQLVKTCFLLTTESHGQNTPVFREIFKNSQLLVRHRLFFLHVELSVFWQHSESFDFTVIPFTQSVQPLAAVGKYIALLSLTVTP